MKISIKRGCERFIMPHVNLFLILFLLVSLGGGIFPSGPVGMAASGEGAEYYPPPPGDPFAIIMPGYQELPQGHRAKAEVHLGDINNLYRAEIHINFDPSRLNVVDADPGIPGIQVHIGSFFPIMSPGNIILNEANNSTGTVDFIVSRTPPEPPVGGGGPLIFVEFDTYLMGNTWLDLSNVNLFDMYNNPIRLGVQEGGEIRMMKQPPF